jgi:hypothetical protein
MEAVFTGWAFVAGAFAETGFWTAAFFGADFAGVVLDDPVLIGLMLLLPATE